jgi:hypothetical protein
MTKPTLPVEDVEEKLSIDNIKDVDLVDILKPK